MSSFSIEVQVDPPLGEHVSADRLARIVQAVLEAEHQPEGAEVTLVITDDGRVRALNRDFRHVDSSTDVLSFPAQEGGEFITPDELMPYLGDVVISYPTALAQAQEQGHAVEHELALLVVHGTLHLLGYDHASETEQARMWARQEHIVTLLEEVFV